MTKPPSLQPLFPRTSALVAQVALFWLATVSMAQATGELPGKTLAPMLDRALPGVVNISTRAYVTERRSSLMDDPIFRYFFDIPEHRPRQRQQQSLGSGVIIDAQKGYVVTNFHVVEGADEITVTLRDRRSFDAELVGQDPESDVALLRIDAEELTALPLADSDALRVGDFVVAIGNPFGLGQTVTLGIISALGRSGLGIEGYEDFIQTDASINPGNSGGALVTVEGELAGINTAIVGPNGGNIGIGFAIPANMMRAVVAQLAKHGEVRRGQLGLAFQDVTPELAAAFGLPAAAGAVVTRVSPGSPAAAAGLRPGDVILELNGKPVRDGSDLRNAIGIMPVGSPLTIDLMRNGAHHAVKAQIGEPELASADAGEVSEQLAGALLGPIADDHPLKGHTRGIQILEVDRGSPAWAAGLREGDIVTSVNRQSVQSIADFERAIKQSRNGMLIRILRGDQALFLVIR